MNINQLYGGDYLKADDLQGQPRTVTISGWSTKEFDDGKTKVVLSFEKTTKTLVLNATNANTIAESHGYDTDGWVGKAIELRPERVNFAGRMVDAIRAYPVGNGAAAPAPAAAQTPSQAFQNTQPAQTGASAAFNDDLPFAPLHKRGPF